jgi:hypothetical protein
MYKIADEEKYRLQIKEYFESVIHGRLMNIDLNTISDATLQDLLVNYHTPYGPANNCSHGLQ